MALSVVLESKLVITLEHIVGVKLMNPLGLRAILTAYTLGGTGGISTSPVVRRSASLKYKQYKPP